MFILCRGKQKSDPERVRPLGGRSTGSAESAFQDVCLPTGQFQFLPNLRADVDNKICHSRRISMFTWEDEKRFPLTASLLRRRVRVQRLLKYYDLPCLTLDWFYTQ